MTKLHALLLCSFLVPACDSTAATPATAKADAAKSDGKSGDGKAADAPKQDDAALIEAAKKAAMSQCTLPPNDFTDAKIQTSEALVGSILHVWTATGPTPREHKQFVAKKAMVRSVMGDQLDIYITTDGSDPCAVPKNFNINVVSGPFVMTKDGNEVVVVSIADKKPGKYFGRTFDETMADMMGGPPNWLGISYMVKDAAVKEFKPGDKVFPYSSLNSEGRSHIDVTKVELGKKLEAKIHACLGGEDFLIGPIDAGFCPDAQATP